jgi:hypothetical protein
MTSAWLSIVQIILQFAHSMQRITKVRSRDQIDRLAAFSYVSSGNDSFLVGHTMLLFVLIERFATNKFLSQRDCATALRDLSMKCTHLSFLRRGILLGLLITPFSISQNSIAESFSGSSFAPTVIC